MQEVVAKAGEQFHDVVAEAPRNARPSFVVLSLRILSSFYCYFTPMLRYRNVAMLG
jgi:hypothetical protein